MELTDYIQYVVALFFVLALIGILFWAIKKFRGSSLATGAGGRRLSIIEGAVVDSKRRLVLVRRDNVEHLLLLGPTQDVVVETGIGMRQPPTAKAAPAAPKSAATPKAPAKPAPEPKEDEAEKKSGALNWKLSTKEHVEPEAPKKKAPANKQAKSSEIRPGEQK